VGSPQIAAPGAQPQQPPRFRSYELQVEACTFKLKHSAGHAGESADDGV